MLTRIKRKSCRAAAWTLLGVTLPMTAGRAAGAPPGAAAATDIAPYARTLSACVNDDGWVDYRALLADRADLDAFVAYLAAVDPDGFRTWPRTERLAFWMNAYNALTLKAVADHYPVQSIRDIGSIFKSVWDKLTFTVMGRTLTLNHIEHDILRKEFDDPRIHMAINCASIGCPPLANQPLDAGRLDEQFQDLTRRFLDNPAKFRIDRAGNVVHLSPIFRWFGEDFVARHGGDVERKSFNAREDAVLNFVMDHRAGADAAFLRAGAFKLKWLAYDWGLNEAR